MSTANEIMFKATIDSVDSFAVTQANTLKNGSTENRVPDTNMIMVNNDDMALCLVM